jgi:hypothetical protein
MTNDPTVAEARPPAPSDLYLTSSGETGCEMPEAEAQDLIAQWCRTNGVTPPAVWPIMIDQAASLLRSAGYAATPEILDWLASLGQVPPAPAHGWWTAKEFVCGMRCLEARRAWLPGTTHDLKKTPDRRALDQLMLAGEEGRKKLAALLRGWDLAYMLILMAECDNRLMRESLLTKVEGVLHLLLPTRDPGEGDEWKAR